MQDRVGERDDHFIRAGIAQAVGCFGRTLGLAPKTEHDFDAGKLRAHF